MVVPTVGRRPIAFHDGRHALGQSSGVGLVERVAGMPPAVRRVRSTSAARGKTADGASDAEKCTTTTAERKTWTTS